MNTEELSAANSLEAFWRESERRVDERRRRENRVRWYDFHERMRATHAGLAAEHGRKALKLLEDRGEAS